MALPPAFAASALYDSLLQSALKRFLARATLEVESAMSESSDGRLAMDATDDPCEIVVRWFGTRHILHVPRDQPFTAHELRVARAIGEVLEARYAAIFDSSILAARADLFQGLIEDRYVAAFLESRAYHASAERTRADRLATCIEVLRVAALSSYENRPISSGVLCMGEPSGHPRHSTARLYGQPLTAVKSFYRLCDGLNTVFLVSEDGLLLDIVDIHLRTVPRWRTIRPPTIVPATKLRKATKAAATSTPECGTNQNPRKMTLPVMLATNTCPRTNTLTASTSPVENVSNNSTMTVRRCDTGDSMCGRYRPDVTVGG